MAYQRAMYTYWHLLWQSTNLPIMEMLRNNHTLFSEESGEVALSMLVNGQPSGTHANLNLTRRAWRTVREKSDHLAALQVPHKKHRRLISKFPLSIQVLKNHVWIKK